MAWSIGADNVISFTLDPFCDRWFVVYNEERNTSSLGVQGLSTRSIIVKVNRLFRYWWTGRRCIRES